MSGFTTIPDRRVRRLILGKDIFGDARVGDRSVALLKGEMAWDGSVMPEYAKDWWMNREQNGTRTYVQKAVDWVRYTLENRGVTVTIDGPRATLTVDAEYDLTKADRLLMKIHCLSRSGIVYKLEEVGDAGQRGLHIPIFKVTLFGKSEVGNYSSWGLWKDVYMPGRQDVMAVHQRRGELESGYDVCRREGTYCQRLNYNPRETFRKAVNSAVKISRHMPKFDALLAADAARKRERLASSPWSNVEIDEDDVDALAAFG